MSATQTQITHIHSVEESKRPKQELLWNKILFFLYWHIGAAYGFYLLLTVAMWKTWIWVWLLMIFTSHGVSAGTHRLWAHRAYKAKVPLRILLAFHQTLAFQLSIYDWVRDHRLHHKYSDTNYDPHNANRGFFYSHMGWLIYKKSPEVIKKGKQLDLSDLEADPVVMFQKKYYWYFAPIIAFVIPTTIPWYFWTESFWISWYTCGVLRNFITLHASCLVNSYAHMWGNKPYDKNILPVETQFVAHVSFGEGFHNYHHIFPWDYKAAELGNYYGNWTTAFIDFMAKIGWAYDLKYASLDVVEKRASRTGDGSRHNHTHSNIWGWGDKDMEDDEKKIAQIMYKENVNHS